jgi:hypothetical protein
MSSKLQAAILDVVAGTTLIILGFVGVLVRLGVLDLSQAPRWVAFEHWWPLLLIIVGLVVWLTDMEQRAHSLDSRDTLEMPYGK